MSTITTLWLGMGDGEPTHWGGRKRRCTVVDRPILATGRRAWRVRVKPSIPRPRSSQRLTQVILAERYPVDSLEELDEGYVVVNVATELPDAVDRDHFRDGDLVIEYVAEAAHDPDALPDGRDVEGFWTETLGRIVRFIEEHGHSRVPENYHDDRGRLDILVHGIRFHHLGKGGGSEGPFPGVDYAAVLDQLDGWEWDPDGSIAAWEPPASDFHDPRP